MLNPNQRTPTICRCADGCEAIIRFIARIAYISEKHSVNLVEGIARRREELRRVGADAQDEHGKVHFCYEPHPFHYPPPLILCEEPRKVYQLVHPIRTTCQPGPEQSRSLKVKMNRGDVMNLMQHEPIGFSYEVLHQKV